MKSETHISSEAIENYCGKVLKKNSITGRSWSSTKLLIMQNYTDSAKRDVPLTVENTTYKYYINLAEAIIRHQKLCLTCREPPIGALSYHVKIRENY